MKKIISLLLITVLSSSLLVGCGSQEEDPLEALMKSTKTEEEAASIDSDGDGVADTTLQEFDPESLENGTFYVRHINNSCEPLYLGERTFDDVSEIPQNQRVVWFKEDIEKIPTLYQGESLILYTTEEFDEKFVLERFEDYGYSVGIQGLVVTEAGRLKLSTDVEKFCTYPNGDTDALLQSQNENVVIDSLKTNGTEFREDPNTRIEAGEQYQYITRSGSLAKFQKDQKYDFLVYDGTIKKEYVFTADVDIMGSFEVQETLDYDYEIKNVIHINIPEYYNTGYYLVNGIGMFRYVTKQDRNRELRYTDYNTPNKSTDGNEIRSVLPSYERTENSDGYEVSDVPDSSVEYETTASTNNTDAIDDINLSKNNMKKELPHNNLMIEQTGEVIVRVEFEKPDTVSQINSDDVVATITAPSGRRYRMGATTDGALELTFNAERTGIYRIDYENLGVRIPHVTVY